jgi:SPP1 family predicted phage head-tail adaptor
VFAAQTVQAVEEVLFVVNYRDDITTAHVVRFRGVLYDITRVDVFEGYKGDITLYAKLRP